MMTKSGATLFLLEEQEAELKDAAGNSDSIHERNAEGGMSTEPMRNPKASATKNANDGSVNLISHTPLIDRNGRKPSNIPFRESG